MDRPIEVGDLVMVVHTCCTARVNPTIFTVDRFVGGVRGTCSDCGKRLPKGLMAGPADGIGHPVVWLKRIDPPALADSKPTQEQIKERV